MGKSLSITAIAITMSTYHVDTYTIVPGKPIDDDYPLLPSLEQLRSKLVYRKTPLLTPSEIKQINSRQLQSDGSPSMDAQNRDEFQKAMKTFDDAWKGKYKSALKQTAPFFINHLKRAIAGRLSDNLELKEMMQFYIELLQGTVDRAKVLFKRCQLSYNEFFVMLVQNLYTFFLTDKGQLQRTMDKDNTTHQAAALFNVFKEIIFEMNEKKERFEGVTESRQLTAANYRDINANDESYLYTLSFLTRKIMTSVEKDGAKYHIYRYMWSFLQEYNDDYKWMFEGKRTDRDYSFYFGFVLYDEKFIEMGMSKWKFKDDQDTFEEFMGVLLDIDNWDNTNYEVHFKVPLLNDIAFKAQYLVKVLNDGDYGLNNGYKYFNVTKIGKDEAIFLMAIQRVLIEWYKQDGLLKNWKEGRSIICDNLSRDLMKKDYAKKFKDKRFKKQMAKLKAFVGMGTAPSKAVLDWIYASK